MSYCVYLPFEMWVKAPWLPDGMRRRCLSCCWGTCSPGIKIPLTVQSLFPRVVYWCQKAVHSTNIWVFFLDIYPPDFEITHCILLIFCYLSLMSLSPVVCFGMFISQVCNQLSRVSLFQPVGV